MTKVNFFIPAGGEGQRLRPLTENLPKPLLPIARRGTGFERIIDNPIRIAQSLGRKTIVAAHYAGEHVKAYFENDDIAVTTDPGIIHTGGSMILHKEVVLADDPDYIVMIPGDHSVPHDAVRRMLRNIQRTDADIALLGTWQHQYHEVYPVTQHRAEDDTPTLRFSDSQDAPYSIASLGTYAFKASWLKARLAEAPVSHTDHCDLTTDVVFGKDQARAPHLIFEPLIGNEYWQDVGTIRRLYDHIRHLHPQKDPNGNVNLTDEAIPDLTDCVVYAGVEEVGATGPLSKAFVAKNLIERYD